MNTMSCLVNFGKKLEKSVGGFGKFGTRFVQYDLPAAEYSSSPAPLRYVFLGFFATTTPGCEASALFCASSLWKLAWWLEKSQDRLSAFMCIFFAKGFEHCIFKRILFKYPAFFSQKSIFEIYTFERCISRTVSLDLGQSLFGVIPVLLLNCPASELKRF